MANTIQRILQTASLVAITLHPAIANEFDPTLLEQMASPSDATFQQDVAELADENGNVIPLPFVWVDGEAIAQGDMILDIDPSPSPRSAAVGQSGLWVNNVIPYQYDSGVDDNTKRKVVQAMEHWTSQTGIVFEPTQSSFGDYVLITEGSGCSSNVGRIGGKQFLRLHPLCSVGNIIHEIGHTVGLYHHHTRFDRDEFININYDNIKPGYVSNFTIVNDQASTVIGYYDYGSIMHYSKYAFSDNGQPTITPKVNATIGQRSALSDMDIRAVKNLYATDITLGFRSNTRDIAADTSSFEANLYNQSGFGANVVNVQFHLPYGTQLKSISASSPTVCNLSAASCQTAHLGAGERVTLKGTLRALKDGNYRVSAIATTITNDELSSNNYDAYDFNIASVDSDTNTPSAITSVPVTQTNTETTAQQSTPTTSPSQFVPNQSANQDTVIDASGGGAFNWLSLIAMAFAFSARRAVATIGRWKTSYYLFSPVAARLGWAASIRGLPSFGNCP
ncbi:MAG: hypothetical protein HWE20_02295 [Gammaproteobacteria bacterium]|nr:hypothetical protein [Gammaproteobacteria bacterium]